MLTIEQLYDLNHTLAADYLRQFTYPWEALVGIKAEILRIGAALDPAEYTEVSEHVWVHKTATVAPTAYLGAPCIIGARTEVRHCAFIRGSALVGGRLRGRQLCGAEERDSFSTMYRRRTTTTSATASSVIAATWGRGRLPAT